MATGWERLAVFEGGTVSDLAKAQAADGSWHVFAATPVGVFRSVDRGRTWAVLGTGARVAGAEVVAASPRYAEDGLVYVGAPDGVYRLQDEAGSWQQILTDCAVQDIELHAGDLDARADGSGLTVFVGTEDDGILVSRDGGTTWAGSNAGLLDLCVNSIALSPAFAEDGTAFAATISGLYRTRNGGEAWRQIDVDGDDRDFDEVIVSLNFPEDRIVLVNGYDWGLFRSDDAGRSWGRVEFAGPPFNGVESVAFWTAEHVVAWSELGLVHSEDGGLTWPLDWTKQANVGIAGGGCPIQVPATGSEPEVTLAGSLRTGVHRSLNSGGTWTESNSGLNAGLTYNLVLSPHFLTDRTMFFLWLDGGAQVSYDGGRAWSPVRRSEAAIEAPDHDAALPPELTPRQIDVIPSPDGERVLVAASSRGLHLSPDDGAEWQLAWGAPAGTPTSPPTHFVDWFATVPTAAGVHILAGASVDGPAERIVICSRDGGSSWTESHLRVQYKYFAGMALAPDAGLDGPCYAVTHLPSHARHGAEITLWRSATGEQQWQIWHEDPGGPDFQLRPLVALPVNQWDDTVVLALGTRILRPRPNAWEVSGGTRRPVWDTVELAGGIAGLTASPDYARDRTLFAATSAGVYVSRDGGASFTRWSEGLEPVATVAVAVSPAYVEDRLVYGLGLGGTIWRRTDC